jgi:methenyltetrahydromethanopterin cyclohydrolase
VDAKLNVIIDDLDAGSDPSKALEKQPKKTKEKIEKKKEEQVNKLIPLPRSKS